MIIPVEVELLLLGMEDTQSMSPQMEPILGEENLSQMTATRLHYKISLSLQASMELARARTW
jgi:hypothetical protein